MNLTKLPKIVTRGKKRLGRGHGSGKVKTSGRGTKGQKARDTIRPGFEGGQLPLVKRLPLWRGKGRNQSRRPSYFPVSLAKLTNFSDDAVIDLPSLVAKRLAPAKITKIKILAAPTTLPKRLKVKLVCSAAARSAIEKAGGKVSV